MLWKKTLEPKLLLACVENLNEVWNGLQFLFTDKEKKVHGMEADKDQVVSLMQEAYDSVYKGYSLEVEKEPNQDSRGNSQNVLGKILSCSVLLTSLFSL